MKPREGWSQRTGRLINAAVFLAVEGSMIVMVMLWSLIGARLPAVLLLAACTLVILTIFACHRAKYRRLLHSHIACLLIACVLGGAAYLYGWPRGRRAFFHDLHSVKPGMTRSQAKEIMRPYLEGTGLSASDDEELVIPNSLVYRWNDKDGAFNADMGIIRIKDGKVVGVDFSPD